MPGPTDTQIENVKAYILLGRSPYGAAAKAKIKRGTFKDWLAKGRAEDATGKYKKLVDAIETAEDMWMGNTEQDLSDNEAAWVKIRLLESRARKLYGKAGASFEATHENPDGTVYKVVFDLGD